MTYEEIGPADGSQFDLFTMPSNKYVGPGKTFNDVLVIPGHGEGVDASEVDLTSRFSRNIELKTPIVSSAMDSVTGPKMAIAMAKLGGLGVIHASLSIEEQKRAVRRVKLELGGLIERPITVTPGRTIQSVLNECESRPLDFRNFPVVNSEGRLEGVLTSRNLKFNDLLSRRVNSVMTPIAKIGTAPVGTTKEEAYKIMAKRQEDVLPLVDKGGFLHGLYLWSNVSQIIRGDTALYNVDKDGRLRTACAVSTRDDALERIQEMRQYLDVIVIDTAHGDSRHAYSILERIKSDYPDLDVVAGNVGPPASARALAERGADGIKIGVGSGSICTTRINAGIGMPQISGVYACAQAVKAYDPSIPVCSDGGIEFPGDIIKAVTAGAHSVMLGNMLAGTDETPGEVVEVQGKKVKNIWGMGSRRAMNNPRNARDYGEHSKIKLLQGVEGLTNYKGSVYGVVALLAVALAEGMGYCGAPDLAYVREKLAFIGMSASGLQESYPHGVWMDY